MAQSLKPGPRLGAHQVAWIDADLAGLPMMITRPFLREVSNRRKVHIGEHFQNDSTPRLPVAFRSLPDNPSCRDRNLMCALAF